MTVKQTGTTLTLDSQRTGSDQRQADASSADLLASLSTSSRFQDTKIHSWYTSVMAFPDHLVVALLDYFKATEGDVFLDPHCGSGTALVEGQRRGLRSFGIDANPSSVLASSVKTNWAIDISQITAVIELLDRNKEELDASTDDPIISYLRDSGMIDRGWIVDTVAARAVGIKRWIDRTISSRPIRRFFMLALIACVVKDLSNVKFGPELYCVATPTQAPDALECLIERLTMMVSDLESLGSRKMVSEVRLGDSRDGRTMRFTAGWEKTPAYVVTSPPYPTEHDYTRNSRLELVFMEAVSDLASLRRIKKRMIRSHSKGIYVNDRDGDLVSRFEPVADIRRQIIDRIDGNSSGFEGQYPKVVSNYFGGMLRHFRTLSNYLPTGSKLAYVVGDQASFKGVHIPTAQLLVEVVDTFVDGLKLDQLSIWRSRRAPKNRQPLYEHVIILEVE